MLTHGFPPGNTAMTYIERDFFILSCKVRDIEATLGTMSDKEIKDLHEKNFKSLYMLSVDVMRVANRIEEVKNAE
jgi:hypothetical protein